MDATTLGIDVGTTSTRAVLVQADGAVLAEATREYPLSTPRPNWSEQDPGEWWNAAIQCIREVIARSGISPGQIAAIGLTGQMHGLVLLDAKDTVLRPAILWNDQRTGPQCEEITRRIGLQRLIDLTGNRVLPGFTAPKILWVREHEPQVLARTAHVLLPKDYVRFRLTGAYRSDVADASGTSLFDVARRRWSDEMCEELKVPASWLPDVAESTEVTASVSPEGSAFTGLAAGAPVVAGAGDQAAQAVGTGIVEEGLVSITIGTSGVVFSPSRHHRFDREGRLHAFCHAVPGMWHQMGVMLAAGGSLRWYRDALCEHERLLAAETGRDVYDVITQGAAGVPAGSEGLQFLPYLSGERTPYADPDARGVFCGLTMRHSKAHLTRAVLEGVANGLRDCVALIPSAGVRVGEIRVSGGGARSPLWRQILADVLDADIVMTNATQGAAFGAALLAAVGAGIHADVASATGRLIHETHRQSPGRDAEVYAREYQRYRELYPALARFFHGSTAI